MRTVTASTFPMTGQVACRYAVQAAVSHDDEKMNATDLLWMVAEAGSAVGACVLLNWAALLS